MEELGDQHGHGHGRQFGRGSSARQFVSLVATGLSVNSDPRFDPTADPGRPTRATPEQSGVVLKAPAKLNLFLHVVGRRADGYHELQTVFEFVDLYDEIAYKLARTETLFALAARAASRRKTIWQFAPRALLKRVSGSPLGAEIDVRKVHSNGRWPRRW